MSQEVREEETRKCGRAKASAMCSIQREVYIYGNKWLQKACNLVWCHWTSTVLSLHQYIRKAARRCVKTTGEL